MANSAEDFRNSKTKENLMRAFAGESQARNRYYFAAEQAKKQQLFVLEKLFKFTADQEQEHAEVFYNHLSQVAGENVTISDAGYPVNISEKMDELLDMAEKGELEEYSDVYPAFAKTAKEEGYYDVYSSFDNISKIERGHAEKFSKFNSLFKSGKLFTSETEGENETWYCLNCGFIFEGVSAPLSCPACKKPQGYFIRLGMTPWGIKLKEQQ